MSLAQVVYSMSTDNEFAVQWDKDPEMALVERDLHLSSEELAFLKSGLKRGSSADKGSVRLSELALISRGWM